MYPNLSDASYAHQLNVLPLHISQRIHQRVNEFEQSWIEHSSTSRIDRVILASMVRDDPILEVISK